MRSVRCPTRPGRLVLATVVLALVVAGCGDDQIDSSLVSGESADLVVIVVAGAPKDQVDAIRLALELGKSEGSIDRYEYADVEDARQIAGIVAEDQGGQVATEIPTLFTVWTTPGADVGSLAGKLRSTAGVLDVTGEGLGPVTTTASTAAPSVAGPASSVTTTSAPAGVPPGT